MFNAKQFTNFGELFFRCLLLIACDLADFLLGNPIVI